MTDVVIDRFFRLFVLQCSVPIATLGRTIWRSVTCFPVRSPRPFTTRCAPAVVLGVVWPCTALACLPCSQTCFFDLDTDLILSYACVAVVMMNQVGSSGVFWVTEGADLEELDDASVDLVLVFNISHQLKGSGISALLQQFHRVLKRGGSLAGTGTFQV